MRENSFDECDKVEVCSLVASCDAVRSSMASVVRLLTKNTQRVVERGIPGRTVASARKVRLKSILGSAIFRNARLRLFVTVLERKGEIN